MFGLPVNEENKKPRHFCRGSLLWTGEITPVRTCLWRLYPALRAGVPPLSTFEGHADLPKYQAMCPF